MLCLLLLWLALFTPDASRYHERIEEQVIEVKHKFSRRQDAGPSGKDSKLLQNQMKRKRGLVSKLLDEMYVWMCVGTGSSVEDVAYTSAQISSMYATGDAPWVEVGQGTSLYFGRVYHRVHSDRARCMEELVILPVERQRLQAWLQYCLQQIDVCLSAMPEAVVGSQGDAVEAHARGHLGSGKAFFLRVHQRRMVSMLSKMEKMEKW